MASLSKKLIGFEKIFITLKENLINKTLSNSLIFYGNKGIGKSTLTYSLINYIFDELCINNFSSNKVKKNIGLESAIAKALLKEKKI